MLEEYEDEFHLESCISLNLILDKFQSYTGVKETRKCRLSLCVYVNRRPKPCWGILLLS